MRDGLAVAALLCAFATGCGGQGRDTGTIVFQSDRSGREALYAARPDGSEVTKLIDGAGAYWTRDGTKVLLDHGSASFVFEPASRARRNVRLPESVVEPPQLGMPWSPDGKRLAFVSNDGDVVVLDVETGERRALQGNWSVNDLVQWSPNGERVLFASGNDFYAVPARGGGRPTRLMRLAGHEPSFPQWSSDGKWISFFDFGGINTRLYVVRSDGTGLHLIAHDAQRAAWSPAGERLAFPSHTGIVLVDVENGRRRQLTERPIEVAVDEDLAWSPDGERILYARNDLVHGAPGAFKTQLWTMKTDGTEQQPVTHAFPGDGTNLSPAWVEGTVTGTPTPTLPLVSLRGARTVATRLPITALGANGKQAAVGQGFGGPPGFRSPTGPIMVWNPGLRNTVRIPVTGCGSTPDVLFAAGGVGYRCDNPSVSYGGEDSLRVARPGVAHWTMIVHTSASEFSGSLLGGIAGDGDTIAFDVGVITATAHGEVRIRPSRIWKVTGARRTIVRTFPGEATVASVDAGRIAVLRAGKAVSVLFPGGGSRTFASGRRRILGAALDGRRLLVLEGKGLSVFDLETGRRTATWTVRPGFGPPPVLEDAKGDLAAYVVGVAIHVVRLSDGREFVIETPSATGPVFARFVPSGLFYAFNESYDTRPGRLVFVARSELERALASRAAAP